MTSNSNSSFDELEWVIQIRRTLDEELEDNSEVPVCIFNVPKTLMATKPDCYVPQEVALGPYHRWRPELYEMERYKLAAAKRIQKNLQSLKFHSLVDQLTKHEPRIRACYHKFLEFNGETLAWMMAIDASFLLEFLQVYAMKEGRMLTRVSSRMSHLVDYAGTKSAHNAILRDMVMLENQIPLLVLRQVLEFQFSSLDQADDMLCSMLTGFGEDLCPFGMMENLPKIQVEKYAHLLDFLYHLIVPRSKEPSEIIEVENENESKEGKEESFGDSSYVQQLFEEIWKLLSKMNRGPVRILKRIIFSKPVKVILKLPWTIVSNLPGFAILKQPVEYFFFSQDKEENKPENGNSKSNSSIVKPPLIEEITIPSVSELSKSGVRFLPTNGGISSITFDAKMVTLYLPTVSLDVNTEVTLRNLVAYESSNASGPLVITRYTELMNGIIDTKEDAKFLRERGIVLNRLKSDEEVANLWNGMSRSIRLTKVPFLDKVIEDVNKYHSGRWKVKAGKFMKRYVFGSWQFLTFLAAILIVLLMTLQAFCSVYSCPRIFNVASD
ncbi:hypothetical protein VitviT2T_019232 [Vitis vinifera]|uniref:Uncharacterized protein n=1 Tax=Vitis vinifera TaxID=29760 RepID=A0ABY9D207_VITVI|nr:putative UPF0481 protein At3g02645 [Vitis vinifera]WKA00916.1 hypothetical protein VitviT2T_019232 [Vitis vinifera]